MDLLITIDARATRATVRPATPGVLPPDSMVIHAGKSFYDVPYDTWRKRVGETVDVREMQRPPEPAVRTPSIWNRPVGRRGTGVLFLVLMLSNAADLAGDPPAGLAETSFAITVPLAIVFLLIDPILDLPLPRWIVRSLMGAMVVLLAVSLMARGG